jgi:lambda repressor-like predicted transcriptional regulator
MFQGMNKLDKEARAKILHLLCEGSSIRAVTRLTGVSKNTVTKLLVDPHHKYSRLSSCPFNLWYYDADQH